ncbi:hypothetical protein PC116_g2264 [Phytophthora cactorum]|uniref:Ankyrin repeat-containing domain n=2 Tax=Phytophthora cactorum TaxID=29920 RepID=A0A329SVZ9_9STRA|nr:hypothetical protein PC112_g2744 [Phytophthora cactorum]KAG2863273.1 hypothetical protein PC113_g5573 [Phytophthora cactorum]KAG4250063.1 hypothetical protein PC116_g2264 [Phytophthora cactorum]RAW40166.1 hypothetical protein PC110_g3646 [Phytophthora cactorum]
MVSVSPTPLLAVSLLFRSKPRFAAIDHVISSVSAYADSSVEFPLNKACKYGSVTLLDRIWNCTVDLEPGGWGLWSVRKLLRTYKLYGKLQFTLCLLEAVKINKVDIVQWLFEHFPDYGVRRKVIYHAASAGALEILQYFRANGTVITNEEEEQEDDGEWDEEKENWERGRWVRWGGLDAAKAAIAGHSDVVKWMYETYAHTGENRNDFCAIDGAFIAGNMELANWLMDELGMRPEGHDALHGAAANGHVEPLQWLQERGEYTSWDAGTLFKAAEAGQLNVVRWIVNRDRNDGELGDQSGPDEYNFDYSYGDRTRRTYLTCLGGEATLAIHGAAINGHLEVAKYLRAHADKPRSEGEEAKESWRLNKRIKALSERLKGNSSVESISGRTMLFAAEKGFLDVVQWLYAEYHTDPKINLFWVRGHIDEYGYSDNDNEFDDTDSYCSVVDAAAGQGHLEIVQYFLQIGQEEEDTRKHKRRRIQENLDDVIRYSLTPPTKPRCTAIAMDVAAAHGHLDVVRWLHANRTEGCTKAAMDLAATNGHLDTVKWLQTHRSEGCTVEAMDGAASGGHLDVVKWLQKHRTEGCTTAAMDNAASGGHFAVLKWLSDKHAGCTVAALDGAATYGKLEVVKWLHRNRAEGCRTLAMDGAAHGGYLRVLRWLFENRKEGFTERALDNAARYSQFETLLILHNIAQQGLAKEVEIMDKEESNNWISEHYHDIARAEFYSGNGVGW